jgi:hypothetical protein
LLYIKTFKQAQSPSISAERSNVEVAVLDSDNDEDEGCKCQLSPDMVMFNRTNIIVDG